ncbi:DUF5681 domain-containing protein [Teredinibacter turnerae]|uniref:DUF5681 domain-containing protein n=1 Tax=Teredinibacter turnerae TaxID=2426 RepID=UPI00036C389A|nr:DUF5681 domain-containing protein [Teredinibacter turnerae]
MTTNPWERGKAKKEIDTTLQDPQTGRFVKGNSGRKQGSRSKVTKAIENMMDGEAEALTRRCIELAFKGDPTALKICFDRIAPIRKGRPLSNIKRNDGENSVEALMRSVLDGEITPEEGKDLVSMIESAARIAANQALSELRQKQIDSLKDSGIDPAEHVMIVPSLQDPDQWSNQAVKYQEVLKRTVRD